MSSRCLLVDADQEFHDVLVPLLQRDGRKVQDAYDGHEALNQLRNSAYEVVVAGQGRNGFDGLKFLRRVRAICPDTRVIVAGDADPARVLGAIRNRAYCYFHKPVMASALVDMVSQAANSSTWKDDIRLVSARPEWISLDMRCKLEAVERTTQYLREVQADLPQNIREDIASALRELLMNAVEHGAKSDARKKCRVALLRTTRAVIAHVHDPGTGFSLELLPHAAISNPDDWPTKHVEVRAEQGVRPGGFGILMTRNLVDDLIYNERGNAALFVKYL